MMVLIVAFLVIGACLAAPWFLKWLHAQHSAAPREPVELVFPMPSRRGQTEPLATPTAPVGAPTEPMDAPRSALEQPRVWSVPPGTEAALKQAEHSPRLADPSGSDTVHFRRPADEAVQLLPGRLEVLSGLASLREIRFVRVPGERPEVFLGREPGSSPQHVSLPSSTVSRQHARLDFSGGRWSLTNLSRTNPVVVNDERLSNVQGHRALVDGDRIELGDVVLRFRAH